MKRRVVVAMSGGVDSSVASALLKEKGYEVIGITMCFSLPGHSGPDKASASPRCCGREAIADSRRVAHKLGIRHYVLNFSRAFQDKVIADFYREYLRGRTPNPCVRCNQYIKFDALLKKALSLDADYLATGHYARIASIEHRASSIEKYLLKKAKDLKKDQSYFLYRLNQAQLKRILFPLGNYTKIEVRELARKFNLPVAEKRESQDICFLPGSGYREFIRAKVKTALPGPIVDKQGNILGTHKGAAFYTIGQRQGLGIAFGRPLYVIKINARNNQLTVGTEKDAYADEFFLRHTHFIARAPKKTIAAAVRIRYNHKQAPARIIPYAGKIKVKFNHPQFAITAGQSAVFYDRDIVLGGGVIDEVC